MTSPNSRGVAQATLRDLIDLRGRTAVVTGGAQGIGRAVCNRLAEAGATVVVAVSALEVSLTDDQIALLEEHYTPRQPTGL